MATVYSTTLASTLDYVTYYIYIVEGSLLFTLNICLILFICYNKQFRSQKEFIIYIGVLFYDAFFGLAHVAAGTVRIQVYLTETCKLSLGFGVEGKYTIGFRYPPVHSMDVLSSPSTLSLDHHHSSHGADYDC